MSIFNALFGGGPSNDDPYYTDTDSQGDTSDDAYMYRSESDGTYTPLTKSQYRDETKNDWKNGYYDDPIFKSDDDDDEPKKGWFGLW